MLEKLFGFDPKTSTVKTEVMAGITTFLTMAYILAVNPNILGETGLVRPGEYVQTVALTTIPKSGTPITLKIMAYEPDTYYSAGAASLNTTFQ